MEMTTIYLLDRHGNAFKASTWHKKTTDNWGMLKVGEVVFPRDEHTNCVYNRKWSVLKICGYKEHCTDWTGFIYICTDIYGYKIVNEMEKEWVGGITERTWGEELGEQSEGKVQQGCKIINLLKIK